MESETVKMIMMGVLLLVAAWLLWLVIWYSIKAAIWGEWNEEELPMPTDEDRKRLEEIMSSRFGKDWREKILNGKI